ncbi:MAG: response regulator [Planctomycetaceae bacterium]|nr:MAG: response regulator [Planctomycetaceae bacterium]
MTQSLKISIADDEPRMREFFRKSLERLGHEVVSAAGSGRELRQHCELHQPDLVITDIAMPDGDGLEIVAELTRQRPLPVILVSAHHSPEFIERARQNNVLAYLIKPITDTDLVPAIAIAMARFEQFQTLEQEATNLKQALEDRKVIERAKGILMTRSGLEEPDAFRRLQKIATGKSMRLVEVAQAIVTAEDALRID